MNSQIISLFLTFFFHILLFAIPISLENKDEETKVNKHSSTKTIIEFTLKKDTINNKTNDDFRGVAGKATKKKAYPNDREKATLHTYQNPIYPKKALNFDLEGKVTALVNINKKGLITKVKILKSSGHAVLDQSFIKALYASYRFKPKRKLGKNLSSQLTLSYDFKL